MKYFHSFALFCLLSYLLLFHNSSIKADACSNALNQVRYKGREQLKLDKTECILTKWLLRPIYTVAIMHSCAAVCIIFEGLLALTKERMQQEFNEIDML